MFIFYLLGVGLSCRLILCQFWLCEEAQCVYLCRHLGSPIFYFLISLFIFIQLQLSAFSPYPSTPPPPIPPPSLTSTLPLDFVLVSFRVAPVDPSSHYPLPTPLWLLLHCS